MKRGSLYAWLQLMRLPNIFTAVADVMMGYLVTHGTLEPVDNFVALVVTSCLLYLSGMVLNDVFDVDVDSCDRPERPIPSGRVGLRSASAVGWAMLVGGILIGWCLAYAAGNWLPGVVATVLALCVVLYDRTLKRTAIAPLLMGGCRLLNVLLGMSLAPLAANGTYVTWGSSTARLIAASVGIYVVGLTIFARTEVRESSRPRLAAGLMVLLAGLGLLAAVPALTQNVPPIVVVYKGWLLLWLALALITGRRCVTAVMKPIPQNVQAAVRHCVQSIIVVDTAVCVGYVSPYWALAVLALLLPTYALTRWLNAT